MGQGVMATKNIARILGVPFYLALSSLDDNFMGVLKDVSLT